MIYPQILKRSPKRPTLRRRAEALRKEMEKPSDQRRDAATVVNEVMEGPAVPAAGNGCKVGRSEAEAISRDKGARRHSDRPEQPAQGVQSVADGCRPKKSALP
jgi:hypothetical protein